MEMLGSEINYDLPDEVMDEFLSVGEVRTYKKWENLIGPDDYDPDLYIIIDGIMRCWYWDGDHERTAYFTTIPTFFMNYTSYFAHKGSFYDFQAITKVKAYRVKKSDFDSLVARHHSFAIFALKFLQGQMYYFELKHKTFVGQAQSRYDALLEKCPEVIREVPLNIIASYLGITPQYLSKLRQDTPKDEKDMQRGRKPKKPKVAPGKKRRVGRPSLKEKMLEEQENREKASFDPE